MPFSLLYVSRSNLQLPSQAAEVDEIVRVAQGRNSALGVTGALVFTEKHFAQNLEGPEEAVTELMESIARDPRHRDLEVVYSDNIAAARFAMWTMAYAGPSTFVAGNVLPLTDSAPAAARRRAAERLIMLMQQFAEAQLAEQRRNSSSL